MFFSREVNVPMEGTILLNGIDIRKYNYREYMNVLSVVFQDFQFLAMSLGENIAAGSGRDVIPVISIYHKIMQEIRILCISEKRHDCYNPLKMNNE